MQANQGQRQDSMSQNQANRQASASGNQAARQNAASDYSGGCYNCGSNWDNAAAGFVAGAVVVGAAAAASQPTYVNQAPAPAPVAPPCNVAPIPVEGVPYYKCGPTWYVAGYGSSGVVYMPVAPPPGY